MRRYAIDGAVAEIEKGDWVYFKDVATLEENNRVLLEGSVAQRAKIESLEFQLKLANNENTDLRRMLSRNEADIEKLHDDVKYHKNRCYQIEDNKVGPLHRALVDLKERHEAAQSILRRPDIYGLVEKKKDISSIMDLLSSKLKAYESLVSESIDAESRKIAEIGALGAYKKQAAEVVQRVLRWADPYAIPDCDRNCEDVAAVKKFFGLEE